MIGTALGCFIVVVVGGFLLGAAGKTVALIVSLPAFAGFIILQGTRKGYLAAFCFALVIAAGFGVWLTEN